MAKNLSEDIQQGLLILLIYETEKSTVLRDVLEENYFIKPYDSLARLSFKFIDAYHTAPLSHIYDLIEEEVGNEELKGKLLEIADALTETYQNKLYNIDYIMGQLDKFVRKSGWVVAIEKCLASLQKGEVEMVEDIVSEQMKKRVALFDAGTRIDEEFLNNLLMPENREWEFQFGIPAFDERGLGFLRGEIVLLSQPPKSGKTMGLIHMAKTNILRYGKKVCHVNLEVSHDEIRKRYLQSFFEMTKRQANRLPISLFEIDVDGKLSGMMRDYIEPRYLSDVDSVHSIKKDERMELLYQNLMIKTFPSGSLTVGGLKIYLENLIEREKFVPDIVIVDYPDIMRIENKREKDYLNLDQLIVDLRGIAGEYNVGMLAASQLNKEGKRAGKADGTHLSGSYGKVANADVVLTYSRKQREEELGLARLSISEARRIESGLTAIISQQYALSQYCIDSVLMDSHYFETLNEVVDE